MTVYRLGSRGPEVTAIQTGLKSGAFYLGPLDGDFGSGTQAAASAFQRSKNIDPDGCVGAYAWSVLFGGEIPVQHPVTHAVFEPWKGLAKDMGRTREFQSIQARHASAKFDRAVTLCNDFGLRSERAAALMFDIVVQNGGINTVVRAQIQADLRQLTSSLSDDGREEATMEIVANRRAQAANPRWVDDVRSRKLCIARGAGVVHGITYDLQLQFGLGLQPFIA